MIWKVEKKEWFGKVAVAWGKKTVQLSPVPEIKILKPAKVTTENTNLEYYALYKNNQAQWKLINDDVINLRLEWYLVRVDQYNNTMFIKKIGEGSSVKLAIPMEPQYYRLYLGAVQGEDIKMVNTTLNTPLY